MATGGFNANLFLMYLSDLHKSTGESSQPDICLNDRERLTADTCLSRPIGAADFFSVCRAVSNKVCEKNLAKKMLEVTNALCSLIEADLSFNNYLPL